MSKLIWRHKELRSTALRVCASSYDIDEEGILQPRKPEEGYPEEVCASLGAHPLFYSEIVKEPKPAQAKAEKPAAKKAAKPKSSAAKKPSSRKRKASE